MSSILIVATADNHLGRYHARMSPARLEMRRERLREGFERAATYAAEHRADLFLHGGDLFDTPSPSNADLDFVASCLRRLRDAGTRVFAVGGNHDTPSGRTVQGGIAPLEPLAELDGLTYFGSDELEKVRLELGGRSVCVGGLTPFPGHGGRDPLDALASGGEDVEVFVTHGCIEGHGITGGRDPVLLKRMAAALPNLRLVIAGHDHGYAVERAGSARLVAPGATEQMTFGEIGNAPGFAVIRLGDGEVRVRHERTAAQPREVLTLTSTSSDGDLGPGALELIERAASPDAMLKLYLAGPVSREEYRELEIPAILAFGQERCFHFELDVSQLYIRDEFASEVARGVRISQQDEIRTVTEEMIAAASADQERSWLAAARDAILERYA